VTLRRSIPFLAGLAVALGGGWLAFPRMIYQSRPQPVNFSHKLHVGAGAKCEDCHSFRDDGTFAGLPTLDKCSGCHAAPMGATAAEKNFIDRYVTPNREPQWSVYARQPQNVSFSHAAHVKRAGMTCESCHGSIGTSDTLRVYRADRISGYSADIWKVADLQHGMKMADCVACHRQNGLEHSCLDCHK
jgi:hypothetical protein